MQQYLITNAFYFIFFSIYLVYFLGAFILVVSLHYNKKRREENTKSLLLF